jgi:hypothetical protein
MNEILHILLNPLPNAIMSGLMIVILLYWIASFLGISFDDLDLGVEVATDIDTDFDIAAESALEDVDADMGEVHTQGVFIRFLQFLNIGKVPFMLVLSCLIFFVWAGSLITTYLIPTQAWGWKAVLLLIPLLILSVFITRIVTIPIARLLEKTGYRGEDEIDFFGSAGKMLSTIEGSKIGIAEFIIEKDPIKLNVVSLNGDQLKYGDIVIITDARPNRQKIYSVAKNI